MPIPFVRQFTDGKKSLVDFACPPDVEAIAVEFISRGGAYIIEELPDGKVGLGALLDVNPFTKYVETETVENGPELPRAAERLIRASLKHLDDEPANDIGQEPREA